MKEILVTEPLLFSAFSCIGSACREHCCAGWRITLDKKTVKRYQNSKDLTIRNIAVEAIEVTKSSHASWGHIKLDEKTGDCPFLDSTNLCSVHSRLGHQALSPTCSTFPRLTRHYKNETHNTITLSCPQVSQLLITRPDAMSLEQSVRNQISYNDAKPVNLQTKLVHLFCLNILNSAIGSPQEQLFAIVKFCMLAEKVDVESENAIDTLSAYYQQLIEALAAGVLRAELDNISARKDVKANLVFLIQSYYKKPSMARGRTLLSHYMQLVKQHFEIDNEQQTVNKNKVDDLSAIFDVRCKPWFAEREYVLRNLLLYKFWQAEFPQNNGRTMLQNLYLIVAEYYFLNVLFAVGAVEKGEMTEDVAVDVLYSFHSATQHSAVATDNFHQLINSINLNDDLSLIHLLI